MNFDQCQFFLTPFGLNVSKSQFDENAKKMVVVGMSGGVDSSVSALILKLQGYNTVGLFMKNWDDQNDSECTVKEDAKDAQLVCDQIGISYYAINFVEEYKERVFNNFVDGYEKGFTPNPDILCNREIKFNVFFKKAMALGADFLATGHYCQNINSKLIKGRDSGKDQSYFLYTIKSEILDKVKFPIGSMLKKDVRLLAHNFGLITKAKKDSTGICFIGERNFKNFLSGYIKSCEGNFVRFDDRKIVGKHEGHCFYTIGQRKGLGLGGPGGPWFVSGKDVEKNEVYVVEGEDHPALYAMELSAFDMSWVSQIPVFPLNCTSKIRYRQPDQECEVFLEDSKLVVKFKRAQRAIAPMQSVVFYLDGECLGGAIIEKAHKGLFDLKLEEEVTTDLDHSSL